MGSMRRTWQRIYYAIAMLQWSVLVTVILIHAAISYAVLAATGENELIADPWIYFYYYTAINGGEAWRARAIIRTEPIIW